MQVYVEHSLVCVTVRGPLKILLAAAAAPSHHSVVVVVLFLSSGPMQRSLWPPPKHTGCLAIKIKTDGPGTVCPIHISQRQWPSIETRATLANANLLLHACPEPEDCDSKRSSQQPTTNNLLAACRPLLLFPSRVESHFLITLPASPPCTQHVATL